MKVRFGAAASIGMAVALASVVPVPARAAEQATCAEQYYACLNEASQKEGFWARTWAEQKCNAAWYACMKEQAFGS